MEAYRIEGALFYEKYNFTQMLFSSKKILNE